MITHRTRKIRTPIRIIALVAIVGFSAIGVALATRAPQGATPVDSPLVGHRAPIFAGTDLRSGRRVSLQQFRGRYVFINFFASWCTPCQQETPDLVTFDYQESRKPNGAVLLGVVFHDASSAAREFEVTQGADWDSIADPGGSIAESYGITGPPTTFLVDPNGFITTEPIEGPATVANLSGLLRVAHETQRSPSKTASASLSQRIPRPSQDLVSTPLSMRGNPS